MAVWSACVRRSKPC
ncbi:hypothetical protein F383_37333 [Gossypium arboreum]|uniref:Uncharacterized protein n=1 Tax=Gossypium arboreum TaxID=29729 RepID=A0A0B0MBM6_GOSAR|nr:hypothetical protein F383_37333 [Gossypium arboreum]